MTNAQKNILNSLTIIAFNFAFWLCNYYPRHILEFSSFYSIVSIIINLLYFLIYDWFLIVVFCKNKTLFSKNINKRSLPLYQKIELKKISTLIIIQVIFDLLVITFSKSSVEFKYIFIDIFIIFHWIIIHIFLSNKIDIFKKNIKALILSTVSVLVLILVNIYIDNFLFFDYFDIISKYQLDSPILIATESNAQFLYGIKTLLLDSIIGVCLICLNSSYFKQKDNKSSISFNFSVFLLRIMILIVGTTLAIGFKFLIWPNSTLSGSNVHNLKTQNFEQLGVFDTEYKSLEIYRFSKDLGTDITCYQKHSTYLFKGNINPVLVTSPMPEVLYLYKARENDIVADNNKFFDCSLDNTKAYLYNSQLICFYENDTPYIIRLADIKNHEQNDAIANICKKLLTQGNIFVFEYVCEYLLKYDESFIRNYIERYSKGDFTETETNWMELSYYRSDYVVNFATQFY